jgi:ribonuclease VapC
VIILDASALLSLINHEPRWEVVARAAAGEDATISAVNYSEVLRKSARVGVTPR